MNLDDLIKLAGLSKSADTPVQEQPQDSHDGMRTLIALVTPEQLNQLQGEADLEEEGYQNSGDHYSGEPEEYKGTLGSPADLSLRRYLGANGDHVTVDETKVYEDHKVEDITEAYAQYKAAQNQVVAEAHACGCDDSCACGGNCGPDCNCHSGCSPTNESITEAPYQYDMTDKGDMHDALGDVQNSMDDAVKNIQKAAGLTKQVYDAVEDTLYTDESVEEAVVDEDDVEEDNAFNSAAANAKKAGKKSFSFNGKTYPVKMDAKTADGLTDDINDLRKLAGLEEMGKVDISDYKPSGGWSVLDIKNDEGIPKYVPYRGKEPGGGFFPNPDYILKPGEKFDLRRDMETGPKMPRIPSSPSRPMPDRERTRDVLGPRI
jgi:hypothetical protein